MLKVLLNFIPGIGPFLSEAGTLLANHWKVICVLLMVGALVYQNFSSTRFVFFIETIPHLEQQVAADQVQIKQLTADLLVASKANANLTATIENQNSAIGDWKAVSDKLQAQNAQLAGTLSQMQHDSNEQVMNILKSKTPKTCEDSIQFLRDMKSKLVW